MNEHTPHRHPRDRALDPQAETQAVDFAEIALHAASAQVTYQAALETNAHVREFSLLNFLR